MNAQALETPAPAKPKKTKRRKAAKKPARAPVEFAGLSPTSCCGACGPETGCVITQGGTGFCAHPMKGGLQQSDAIKSDIVARFGRAKKALALTKIKNA